MRLIAPEGCGGVSFEGRAYPVMDGVVEVPDHATVFLEPGYGFTPAPEAKTENRKSTSKS
jgi:hypothetical protein